MLHPNTGEESQLEIGRIWVATCSNSSIQVTSGHIRSPSHRNSTSKTSKATGRPSLSLQIFPLDDPRLAPWCCRPKGRRQRGTGLEANKVRNQGMTSRNREQAQRDNDNEHHNDNGKRWWKTMNNSEFNIERISNRHELFKTSDMKHSAELFNSCQIYVLYS
jgi:hypothetical protein